MKIAVHNSFGAYRLPKGFHRTCNDRADNAELLANWLLAKKDIPVVEVNGCLNSKEVKKIEKLLTKEIGCVRVIGHADNIPYDRFYLVNDSSTKETINISVVKIVDVDTNKFWMLDEYDGMETVKYFKCDRNKKLIELES